MIRIIRLHCSLSERTYNRNVSRFIISCKQVIVLHFACGGGNSTGRGLIDMADFDEDETQFKDIQDSFHNIPPSCYPLVITFHKFLMMLDGTLSNSYFERFLDVKATVGHFKSSRSVAFQSFRFVLILHINCFRLILILLIIGSGVSTEIWTTYAARIMVISIILVVVSQIPQVLHLSSGGQGLAILIALIVSVILTIAYIFYEVTDSLIC
ncbi:hypothetical protein RchiOBHm_Chr2g0137711 [Rosa chinensis]|uniref:Uncharacterized protein n=1 Tax=Rosa chinensis TaxID=74649 RepID=A0A2P6RWP7_ROSCH|nr:hypothetical protein RchiOBHm_Chr2g0137711 [Rosa chinensis]